MGFCNGGTLLKLKVILGSPRDSSIFTCLLITFLLGLFGTAGQAQPHHQAAAENGRPLELEISSALQTERMLGIAHNATNSVLMKSSRRSRRSVVHLYDMVVCATGCNPLAYKGYGCYCGFLGSGLSVDGIDRCCAKHDYCYNHVKCPPLLTYFVPYYWTCSHEGRPQCVADYRGWKGICGTHLCECDRQFAECLRKYPCPQSRAMCVTSPWRFWQNLVMQPPLHAYDYYEAFR